MLHFSELHITSSPQRPPDSIPGGTGRKTTLTPEQQGVVMH